MKILFAVGGFLVGAIIVFVAVISAHRVGYLVVFPGGEHQVELATLFLAAATLIVTTVAMLLAVGAVVGYTALKDAAEVAGRDAGQKAANQVLAEMVRREVADRLARSGPDRTEELTAALAERGDNA